MNVEFTEAVLGKSGDAMAEVFLASLGDDIEEIREFEQEDGKLMRETLTHVGLKVTHKVFAVVGDNAANNDTFSDHYLCKLQAKYESSLFRGRPSRIRCLAHILNLVADTVYDELKAGTHGDAKPRVDAVLEDAALGGVFPADCAVLSVIMKIRIMILWMMKSDERRSWWKAVCNVFLPIDVDTRWNSLYLMMEAARKQKAKINRFVLLHPEVKYLLPTEQDWTLAEQLERTLEPFYNHTLSVSHERPQLPEYLSILWEITDLLDDVASGGDNYGDICDELKRAFEVSKQALQKWVDEINKVDLYFAAHVLDPRLKTTMLRVQYADQADEYIDRIKIFFKENYSSGAVARAEPEPAPQRPPNVSIHTWNILQQARAINEEQQGVAIEDDFERYLTSPCVTHFDHTIDDFLLHWWKIHETEFPTVAKAARDLLAVPIAEVDVERLFSEGRDILGVRRMAMDAETMRLIRLLKSHFDQEDKILLAKAKAQQQRQREFGIQRVLEPANQEPQN